MRNLTRALAVAAVLGACGDSPTELVPNELPVTISGTIQIRNGTTVPSNARVLVIWGVSSASPDYSYVFGEGTVHAGGHFTVTFTTNPPDDALNNDRLGVGLIIATTDQTLGQGQVPSDYTFPGFLGMSEDHSVVFVNTSFGAPGVRPWESGFTSGYNLGEVQRSSTGLDAFRRVALTAARLVIDALDNLNPPNWT